MGNALAIISGFIQNNIWRQETVFRLSLWTSLFLQSLSSYSACPSYSVLQRGYKNHSSVHTAPNDKLSFYQQCNIIKVASAMRDFRLYMRTALFRVITQRTVVISYRRFGETYRARLQERTALFRVITQRIVVISYGHFGTTYQSHLPLLAA